MLKKGDRIICGDKEAELHYYALCVGAQGEITSGPYKHGDKVDYGVRFDDIYGEWAISGIDCIPFAPATNKEAVGRLEEEY